MAEKQTRYSFSQAAAKQPERQRFSFSAAAPQKAPTLTQAMDAQFPYRKMVENVSAQNPISSTPSIGERVKEFIVPSRGFTDEQIRTATPTTKEKFTGTAKEVGEIGVGLASLLHMGGNQAMRVLPGYGKEEAEKAAAARNKLLEPIEPFISPKTAGEAQVMRFADIAGLAVGWTKAGRLDKIKKALVNVDNTDDARKLLRSGDLTDDVITRLNLDQAAVNIKNTKDASAFVKRVDDVMTQAADAAKATGPTLTKQPAQQGTPTAQSTSDPTQFKTLDEFVKAQGTPVFHGSGSSLTEIKSMRQLRESGSRVEPSNIGGNSSFVHVTDSEDLATGYARSRALNIKGAPNVIEARIEGKILDLNTITEQEAQNIGDALQKLSEGRGADARITRNRLLEKKVTFSDIEQSKHLESVLRANGYSGIKFRDRGFAGEFQDTIAVLPDSIKTRTQLEDIWKQAQKTAPFSPQTTKTRFSFADTAKQTPTVPVAKQATEVDVPSLPKIEQRFVGNFPEFRSAERLNELRNRTRSPQSNAESFAKAQQLGYTPERVLRIPEGKALNAEEKMAVSGVVENERRILQKVEERLKTLDPDTEEFNTLRSEASRQKVKVFQMMAVERGVAAEAGRALQAHKATVTAIDQAENRLAKYLAKKSTPQETKDYIYRKIEEFDGSPDELNNLLREMHEATLLEKFVEYATAVKLWNPTTHAVNVLTSLNRMFLQPGIHALSAAFDSVLSKMTGQQRERFLSDAVAEVQGQYMGWKHAGYEALKALKDENYAFESRILKDFEVEGPAIKGRPGKNELRDQIANGFGKVVRIPFRMLGVEDVLIRKPSEMGALYTAINRKARMEGLKPGTKEWNDYVSKALTDPVGEYGVDFMKEVQDIADQNLFQESLHPTLKRVSNWREDVPALKLVVPFFRTIVNLQKQAIEFSALAPILPSARKALREGGGARSDVLAKMTLGTAATIPLMHHALEGNMTMAAPTNPAERDAFYAEGKQPYSVRLGDTWYSYNRFSPFSEWFITAAALAEAHTNEDEKSAAELTAHVFFSLTQNFFDKSFATGMHDLMEALADPERAGNWVENFATGATIPNFIPLAARVTDPVIRETDDLRDAYISKVPYLSKTLDPKRDVFGEPISRPGNAIQKIVSPVIPSPVEVDMVRGELKSIGYQMGFPGKTAGGFQMDDETYRIYQAASGKIVYKALAQMIQNPGYQNLAPRQREQAVDKIVRETRELVKTQVAQEQLIMQEIKNQLKNQGYSSQQADDMAVKTYEIIKRKQEGGQQPQ